MSCQEADPAACGDDEIELTSPERLGDSLGKVRIAVHVLDRRWNFIALMGATMEQGYLKPAASNPFTMWGPVGPVPPTTNARPGCITGRPARSRTISVRSSLPPLSR